MAIRERRVGFQQLKPKPEVIQAWAQDTTGPTNFISDDDMAQTIQTIIQSLPDGIVGFDLASRLYGSDFFENETATFKAALAQALNTKFTGLKNFYWIKLVNENKPTTNPAAE